MGIKSAKASNNTLSKGEFLHMEKSRAPAFDTFRETDLALERKRLSSSEKGVFYKETVCGDIRFTALSVRDEAAREGERPGRTLSLSLPPPFLWTESERDTVRDALRLALQFFFPAPPRRLLVTGLGNRRLTADCLGPLTAEKIEVRAALPEALLTQFGLASSTRIAVCVHDVFSKTGIESVRSIEAAARLFDAEAILAFDALAARETKRLLRVIEITDTGTVPGGGVKRGTLSLSKKELGIPVIAVGIPTVVRADEEHFLVLRDMEEHMEALSAVLADATNLTFGNAERLEDTTVTTLFGEVCS